LQSELEEALTSISEKEGEATTATESNKDAEVDKASSEKIQKL
jgi:hypothetical protein